MQSVTDLNQICTDDPSFIVDLSFFLLKYHMFTGLIFASLFYFCLRLFMAKNFY